MKDAGFTLVEVLAALLIFSLAIVGLSQTGTLSARSVAALDDKMLAGIVADNVLTEARYTRLQTGSRTGQEAQMSRDFDWELETLETDVDGFFQMVVRVRKADDSQVLMERIAFRPEDITSLTVQALESDNGN